MLNQLSVVHVFHKTYTRNITLHRREPLSIEVLVEAIGGAQRVKLYKNAVLVVCSINPDDAHLEHVGDEGAAEAAEVRVGHVVGHGRHAHPRLPPYREIR